MKYFKNELKDKEIVAALRKCADQYENGEILEVANELFDILSAIEEWEATYET